MAPDSRFVDTPFCEGGVPALLLCEGLGPIDEVLAVDPVDPVGVVGGRTTAGNAEGIMTSLIKCITPVVANVSAANTLALPFKVSESAPTLTSIDCPSKDVAVSPFWKTVEYWTLGVMW